MNLFHKRLHSLRVEMKMTQAVFARELGVSQQSVAHWETGRSYPEHVTLKQMVQLFNVTSDYLFGFSDHRLPHYESTLSLECLEMVKVLQQHNITMGELKYLIERRDMNTDKLLPNKCPH